MRALTSKTQGRPSTLELPSVRVAEGPVSAGWPEYFTSDSMKGAEARRTVTVRVPPVAAPRCL